MANPIGINAATLNGRSLLLKGGSFQPGVPTREPIVGLDQVHGHSVRPRATTATLTVTDQGDISIRELVDASDATLTLEGLNGKSYVMPDAWQGGEPEINFEEGEIQLTFYSRVYDEVGVS